MNRLMERLTNHLLENGWFAVYFWAVIFILGICLGLRAHWELTGSIF